MSDSFGNAAANLVGAAAAILGWRPNEFWDATPAELAAALTPGGLSVDGPDRGEIERLQALFPDREDN